MNGIEFSDFVFDNNFRIEKIFYIPGLSENPCEEFENLVKNTPNVFEEFFENPSSKLLNIIYNDSDNLIDFICEEMYFLGMFGFIIEVSTPIIHEGGLYSWGHFNSKWFYVDKIEELPSKVLKWIESLKLSSEKNEL